MSTRSHVRYAFLHVDVLRAYRWEELQTRGIPLIRLSALAPTYVRFWSRSLPLPALEANYDVDM